MKWVRFFYKTVFAIILNECGSEILTTRLTDLFQKHLMTNDNNHAGIQHQQQIIKHWMNLTEDL